MSIIDDPLSAEVVIELVILGFYPERRIAADKGQEDVENIGKIKDANQSGISGAK